MLTLVTNETRLEVDILCVSVVKVNNLEIEEVFFLDRYGTQCFMNFYAWNGSQTLRVRKSLKLCRNDPWVEQREKGRLRQCSYRSSPLKVSLRTFTDRIPSVADPDVLRTYLANKDATTVPKIPVRGRAVGLRAKLGTSVASTIDPSNKIKIKHVVFMNLWFVLLETFPKPSNNTEARRLCIRNAL